MYIVGLEFQSILPTKIYSTILVQNVCVCRWVHTHPTAAEPIGSPTGEVIQEFLGFGAVNESFEF
jgi:hypothetical protein